MPTWREHSQLFGFSKFMVRQAFKFFPRGILRGPPARSALRQGCEDYQKGNLIIMEGKWTPSNKHCRAESISRTIS